MDTNEKPIQIAVSKSANVVLPLSVVQEPKRGEVLVIRTEFTDQTNPAAVLPVEIAVFGDGVEIRCPQVETASDAEGWGIPVVIEHYEGELALLAYTAGNEDPVVQKWDVVPNRQFPYPFPSSEAASADSINDVPDNDPLMLLKYIDSILEQGFTIGQWFDAQPGVSPDHPNYSKRYVEQVGFAGALKAAIKKQLSQPQS
jgi:hypothetical protein